MADQNLPTPQMKQLSALNMERREKIVSTLWNGFCGLVLCTLLTFVFMTLNGSRFAGVLSRFGFYNEEGGLYANCASSKNKKNPFCAPVLPEREKEWRKIGDPVRFSLTQR